MMQISIATILLQPVLHPNLILEVEVRPSQLLEGVLLHQGEQLLEAAQVFAVQV